MPIEPDFVGKAASLRKAIATGDSESAASVLCELLVIVLNDLHRIAAALERLATPLES